MTIRSESLIKTENASKYMQQLCKHWAHKFADLSFDDKQAHIPFRDNVELNMFVEADGLVAELLTPNEEEALRMEAVFDNHIKRFAFREDLEINWQRKTLA